MEKEYKYFYNAISKIIVKMDPVDLLSGGAPDDEYDNEISQIASQCYKEIDLLKIKGIIKKVFLDSFEVVLTSDVIDEISEQVLDIQ